MTDDHSQDPIDPNIPEQNAIPADEEAPKAPEKSDSSELTELREKLARAQADYQNLLMRQERDRISSIGAISSNILVRILPSVDHLERALDTKKDDQNDPFVSGIRSTYSGLLKTLEGLGVVPFASIGEEVDADKHEVVMQGPGEDGKVIGEIEKGYTLHDRILRHAKVIAGNGEKAE